MVELPAGIYEVVLEHLAVGGAGYLVVDEKTATCPDLEFKTGGPHPIVTHFREFFDSLGPRIQEALRDCASKSSVKRRIVLDELAPTVDVRARSSPREYKPSLAYPDVAVSRPGVSADSSTIAVAGSYYCGLLCSGESIFVFQLIDGVWTLVLDRVLWVS